MRVPLRRDSAARRRDMVESQIRRRGLRDPVVLDAMGSVPRHEFVPESIRHAAYADCALPIGYGATISQPYIVALMTSSLEIDRPGLRVLEIGTGSLYQAAILAACGCDVYSIERVPELHRRAARLVQDLELGSRIRLRCGDGSRGWPEEAPFDRVILTAAAKQVPAALFEQVAPGGMLLAPVGSERGQVIRRYEMRNGAWTATDIEGAVFVPLVTDPDPEG